jgi:hypothetical protein
MKKSYWTTGLARLQSITSCQTHLYVTVTDHFHSAFTLMTLSGVLLVIDYLSVVLTQRT